MGRQRGTTIPSSCHVLGGGRCKRMRTRQKPKPAHKSTDANEAAGDNPVSGTGEDKFMNRLKVWLGRGDLRSFKVPSLKYLIMTGRGECAGEKPAPRHPPPSSTRGSTCQHHFQRVGPVTHTLQCLCDPDAPTYNLTPAAGKHQKTELRRGPG